MCEFMNQSEYHHIAPPESHACDRNLRKNEATLHVT